MLLNPTTRAAIQQGNYKPLDIPEFNLQDEVQKRINYFHDYQQIHMQNYRNTQKYHSALGMIYGHLHVVN